MQGGLTGNIFRVDVFQGGQTGYADDADAEIESVIHFEEHFPPLRAGGLRLTVRQEGKQE